MKKKHSDFVWFIYFAWLVVSILGLAGAQAEDIAFETSEIWVESGPSQYHFFVEIAETRSQRQRGLMFRSDLPQNTGMLFDFGEETQLSMWMKNTFIPLDIIWLNSDLEVIYIANAVPCVTEKCDLYGPDIKKTKYVYRLKCCTTINS